MQLSDLFVLVCAESALGLKEIRYRTQILHDNIRRQFVELF